MQSGNQQYITVNELDYVRLSNLIEQLPRDAAPGSASAILADALDQADQLPPRDIPADIVTMHSQVEVQDEKGDVRTLTLCYPKDADAAQGMVSVLSPIGASMLGAKVPGEVGWTPPDGARRSLKIVKLVYQPEANGDFTE